jgi:uncharacterized protein (TIGR02145 family)
MSVNSINKVFLLYLIPGVFIPISLQAQGTFTDTRDNYTYSIDTIGKTIWFTENLRFITDDSFCPNFSSGDEACAQGNFYAYEEAQTVCPQDWRLPKLADWNAFIDLISEEVEIVRFDYNKQFKVDIIGSTVYDLKGLKIKPYGRVQGNRFYPGDFIDYWTIDDQNNDPKYHMHIIPLSIQGHTHRHHIDSKPEKKRKFPVRCVMDMDQVN